uniref:Reverse transcriptase domain-containing protein n=1 Tax=Aegilops tauschii subsp. strangulata TaxID=200361 RepID=A0A453RS56_AEGTS
MPADKVPGPDGFTIAFFCSCWDIIKDDLMTVINAFSELSASNFHIINTTNVVLLPKKDGAESISDFRPISLIHVVPKIITKAMARRLSPKMNDIVSCSQSAFIKSRTIHDNFLYVRNTARRLHRCKTPSLLIKLDIAKAFDTVRWDYMLDLLQCLGFPQRWRALLMTLFTTTSSRVFLNGMPGRDILHGRGFRQGDPLSPLLFDIAINPLQRLLEKATESGLLSAMPGGIQGPRVSLYADDAAIFLSPMAHDVEGLASILHSFGVVSGLVTNVIKSSIAPIQCANINLEEILANFPVTTTPFPIKYLGLPLSLGRLRRVDLQPYIDKAVARLSPWKGKFLNRAGCTALVKSVLPSMPIFLLTALKADKGILKAFAKISRGMLWACKEAVSGGKCKVNWKKVCRPKELGGLGVLDLERFSWALRLRWLWYEWKAPEKPWVGSETPNDASDLDLFNAATRVTIGNGAKASFWSSSWLHGAPPKDLAPLIFKASKRKNRMVQDSLADNNWILDIAVDAFTADHMEQYVHLWELLSDIQLHPDTEDSITWSLTPNGCYSASFAYKVQFLASLPCQFGNIVWKTWAPPKCRFFAWHAVQNRLWTADRLAKCGWPHQPTCQLCRTSPETARHILFECRVSRRIWTAAASWLSCPDLINSIGEGRPKVVDYWLAVSKSTTSSPIGLRSAITLITWEIWKERNERVFNNKSSLPSVVMHKMREEGKDWILAGAKNLAELVG